MSTEVRYATATSGARIAYTSKGDGPAVLVGPASFMFPRVDQRSVWVSAANYAQLIEYDHAGAGLSARVPVDHSLAGLLSEFEAVADAAAPGNRLVLVGNGATGPAAIRFAVEHPTSVDRLVLHNTWATGEDHWGRPGMAEYRALLAGDWQVAAGSIVRIMGGATGEAAVEGARRIYERVDQQAYLTYLDSIAEHDVSELLREVSVPTCVVYSPHSTFPLDDTSQRLAAGISGATLSAAPPPPGRGVDGGPFERAARGWLLGEPPDAATADELAPVPSNAVSAVDLPEIGDPAQPEPTSYPDGLSEREVEVLREVAAGKSNAAIAEALVIAPSTVARHVSNILNKTGLSNRTELATYAAAQGLTTP